MNVANTLHKKKGYWSVDSFVQAVATALKQGQVVAGTSDTVIGLLADTSQAGFQALNSLKQRQDKPYLLVLASAQQVSKYSDQPLTPAIRSLMQHCWPGPLTLVMRARKDLPAYMTASDGTIALRVPNHAGLLRLLQQCGALFSTSANLSGKPVPTTINDLDVSIAAVVAYIVDDEQASDQKLPSTIIDCTGDQLKMLREGAYSRAALTALAPSIE